MIYVSDPSKGADIFFIVDQGPSQPACAQSDDAQDAARDAASLRRVARAECNATGRLTEPEHWAVRLAFVAVLLALLVGFWTITQEFWIPAHGGADQNGYLVGGKMLAEHFSPAQTPPDRWAFVGRMWIATPDGRYFPKYPVGFCVLVAAALKVVGPTGAYLISPVATLLALVAVFELTRIVAGSFAGLLAALIVGTSPVTLALANNPNSHATALCLVTWGFVLILRYWPRPSFVGAALAGLLIGLAATVRYSEATLGLPVLGVALSTLGRHRARAATLVACWVAPIVLLLTFNRLTMGTWTGYGPTGESTGFALGHLGENWDVLLRQLATSGLFLTLPLGVLGLMLLLVRHARLAVVLWLWLVPGLLVYGSYYWAPDNSGIGYARFFLTLFPPLAVGAGWCLTRLASTAADPANVRRRFIAPFGGLVLVLGAGAYNVWAALPILAADGRKAASVARAADQVMRQVKVPPGSVILGPREFLHHLQFVGDYRLYVSGEFDPRYLASLTRADPGEPNPLQPQRAAALYERLKSRTDADMSAVLRNLTADHLAAGRRALAIVPAEGALPLRFTDPSFDATDGRAFTTRTLATWGEPEPFPPRDRGRAASPADESQLRWALVEITVGTRSARR
jgi:hypothetical protein